MNVIFTVLRYDFRRFLRDRLMLAFTIIILVMYIVGASFIPESIAPTWSIAVTEETALALEGLVGELEEDANLKLVRYADEAALRKAFEDGDGSFIGIVIDKGANRARVYVDETSPPQTQTTARAVGAMMATFSTQAGSTTRPEPVRLGPVVEQPNFHERVRASMALMLLMMEMLALASLVAREISSGVVHAVLTTTVSLPRFFVAKLIFGFTLAFVQAGLVVAATGGMNANPPVIAAHLALGALMFTAAGLIAGTRGKHLMEVMMWGLLFLVPALVPGIVAMLPGSPPVVVQLLPTFAMVNGLLTAGHQTPLVAPWVYLLWSAGWTLALVGTAYVTLRRRVK